MELFNVYAGRVEKIKRFIYQYWLIILLTIIGAGLRLYRIEASLQFLGDQGRDALILRNLWVKHDLPFIGPVTSVGSFFLGPLYYYLMAPFLLLANYNPVGPAVATALLGIATIPLVYWVAKKLFSRLVGLWSAALYALAFIPISETRSAWNPNPMPLAALGIIYGFYLANYKNQPKGLLLAAVSLGAALQLHYMIVFLAPFILWQLFLARCHVRELIAAAVIFLLLNLPLLLFEIKNNWLSVRGLMEFLSKHQYGSLHWWQVIKNTIGRSEQVIGMVLGFGRDFSILRMWITRIFLLLLLAFFKPVRFLGIYLLVTIASLAVYQENIYPHYLGFLFPVVFILLAAILSRLPKFLLPLFMLLFLVFNLPQINALLRQNGNLDSVKTTAKFIKNDIDQHSYQNYNLALLDGTRDYPAHSFRYFLEAFGGRPLSQAEYLQTQVLYVISPYLQPNVLNEQIWEIKSLQPAELMESWQFPTSENIYKIIRL